MSRQIDLGLSAPTRNDLEERQVASEEALSTALATAVYFLLLILCLLTPVLLIQAYRTL